MKVSGFTFVRDAVKLHYPVVPAIRSLLPLVDEMVVNVGVSNDGTLELVRAIGDPRLVVFESRWDETALERGKVLAQQTDLALARCRGEVCLYVQADEAYHEEDYPAVRRALDRLADDGRLDGLLFDFVHFYGSFHTVGQGRRWYRCEVRAVKNGVGVCSYKDAQGFRLREGGAAAARPARLRKLKVVASEARIFHYGWARPPALQGKRLAEFERLYAGESARERRRRLGFEYDPEVKVRPFTGSHPGPMQSWVEEGDLLFEPRLRRVRMRNLREDLLDLFEEATGVRLGEYRNYELLR
ncbi:MAG TPA: hypothetical protein VLV17_06165 [Anaeromyxobacteraceae bacterium]|nr:hypothetical protein [Anaeromyxobacteraceae bacterium]